MREPLTRCAGERPLAPLQQRPAMWSRSVEASPGAAPGHVRSTTEHETYVLQAVYVELRHMPMLQMIRLARVLWLRQKIDPRVPLNPVLGVSGQMVICGAM